MISSKSAVLATLLLCACATAPVLDAPLARPQNSSTTATDRIQIRTIEFTDDGMLADQTQVLATANAIRGLPPAKQTVVVLFVHGWRHSGAMSDKHLAAFRQTLRDLAGDVAPSTRQILGVYLAWKGDRLIGPLFPAGFFDRADTADVIGRSRAFKDLVNTLNVAVAEKSAAGNVTALSIGHSLGGKLLFTALEQQLRERPATPPDELLMFGDLTILLNPAQDANDYKMFDQYNAQHHQWPAPVLVTISSNADTVVGRTWTIGQKLKNFFGRNSEDDEDVGLGWKSQQWTHRLCSAPSGLVDICAGATENDGVSYGSLRLIPFPTQTIDGPFYVVRTNRFVISGHSDIFNAAFRRFLVDFVAGQARK